MWRWLFDINKQSENWNWCFPRCRDIGRGGDRRGIGSVRRWQSADDHRRLHAKVRIYIFLPPCKPALFDWISQCNQINYCFFPSIPSSLGMIKLIIMHELVFFVIFGAHRSSGFSYIQVHTGHNVITMAASIVMYTHSFTLFIISF